MKTIRFSKAVTSLLRNGISKTVAVDLHVDNGVVRIQAINSKGNATSGWIEVEQTHEVLSSLAQAFKALAAEVDPDAALKGRYRDHAKKFEAEDCQFEVDDNAEVSLGGEAGAYVQGWRWVYDDKVFTPQELAEMEEGD